MTQSNPQSPKLFSYVVRYDEGAAPNPFGGMCTLTICKPKIRLSAEVGDWIIGTGSQRFKGQLSNPSSRLIYAMKITNKMSLNEYDTYCQTHLPIKLPDLESTQYEKTVGDCLYDYQNNITNPVQRKGNHTEESRARDLSGRYALLSDTFYYFGKNAVELPIELLEIVKSGPGHKAGHNQHLVDLFIQWLTKHYKPGIYGDPLDKPENPHK